MAADGFSIVVLVMGLVGTATVLSNRLSAAISVPAPAFFLIAAAAAAELWPHAARLPVSDVQHVVTVALAVILFDGGMHIGRRRFRAAAGAIIWLGIAGTLLTAAGAAVAARLIAGLDWRMSLLLGTAVAATDPAVVFSVFGRREVSGRAGTMLEGESGANDPVGIALLAALLGTAGTAGQVAVHVVITFATQMAVGAVVGVVGGQALLAFMRRVPLPSEGLYAPRVLAGVLLIYGVAAVAHGSGFLAVLAAGIVIGDENAPYKGEIAHFHSSLASLAEVVAFVMLGLTVRLSGVGDSDAWAVGLALAALLAFVIRPLLVGLASLPVRMARGERAFFLWTGLKGAVPVLLGTEVAASGLPGAARAYEIIFVVVGFSVTVQGGLVPALARRLGVPLRTVEPEPWSAGVRFAGQPQGLHRYHVAPGSPADEATIAALHARAAHDGGPDVWVSMVIRGGNLVTATAETVLQAGDDVLLLSDPGNADAIEALFSAGAGEGT